MSGGYWMGWSVVWGERVSEIAESGVPDTLVHGDFHPGNVRRPLDHYLVLDWGDAYLGPPLVDELAFTRPLGAADRVAARRWFADAWRRAVPRCDQNELLNCSVQ